MPKLSLSGLKDPRKRARFIIWAGVSVVVLAAFMIVALGATSSYWFCSQVCHKVQDDSIIAYNHSTHSKVNCMACHMPVNADPVTFVLHKVEALGEAYLTITDKFELPLNPVNHVSLNMHEEQCTQCHNLANREITPSNGIIIDHEVHSEKEWQCTVCHNRIAHNEDFDLVGKSPDGEPNKKHQDFMSMTACFRCHGLEKGAEAPGTCAACHPKDFKLTPASHEETGFYPKGHAEIALEYSHEVDEADKEREAEEAEAEGEGGEAAKALELPWVNQVFYCTTCHTESFCNNCHGMEMPHPAEFKEPKAKTDPAGHPVVSKTKPAKCVMCHGVDQKTHFCSECHHGTKIGWEYNARVNWASQHPGAVAKSGVKSCTASCHTVKFCADCHTKNAILPTSHKAGTWTYPALNKPTVTVYGKAPAAASAGHTAAAKASMESCEVCHGSGGIEAAFCKACHKVAMPHPDQFKQFHAKTGKANPALCQQCHRVREVCSTCHHIGSSLTRPWTSVHGVSVNTNGATSCVEKCHQKNFCVACHNNRNVRPASHNAARFVRSDIGTTPAGHTSQYKANGDACTYCHAGEVAALPNAPFCRACHKLQMPHTINDSDKQKFAHAEPIQKKQYSKSQCYNCHPQTMCDACHHQGAPAGQPWLRAHPASVREKGAQSCFECHNPTYCANCHVNIGKRNLN